ncbi:M13-type metalloendopeptidase [Lentilactobacillus sp. Marseille-Q4993]|uniref:M13 family metallopeptidase n=1 Tax=Lentilactobacillus sp. Marseille-Q4993 TaxID=3039492 RepID=UPI0024BCBC3C|nr:M13-type metalloendopeptidase [Lentilactobacillus sp. Marseille-Q4993]
MANEQQDVVNESLIKDDLYQAVNGAWQKTAVIPDDHSSTGGFMDLHDNVEKQLMGDFDKFLADPDQKFNEPFTEFLKFYKMTQNFDKRDADGAAPIKPYLDQIEKLSSFDDLNANLKDWTLEGMPLPFNYSVEPDMKNTKINALTADAPSLFLPDRTYYENNNPAYDQLMPILTKTMAELLVLADYSESDANEIVESAKKFDALLAPNVKSSEELADYSKMYNPQKFTEFASSSNLIDLTGYTKDLFGFLPDQVIVGQPKFFEKFNEIVTEDSFHDLKNWILANFVYSAAPLLSEEFRQTASTYGRVLSGRKTATPQKKSAFYLASGTFGQTVGDYYGKKYFGEKAKHDVENMVKSMIDVYKGRLENNDWLSKATREKAVVKLNTLELHVGYPEKIAEIEYKFKVTDQSEGGTVFSNSDQFGRVAREFHFSELGKPVDRSRWYMSANTVNAYYDPSKNQIVFPAAILQAPFYSLDQSSSENFGGIGAVIAHEISHAFDNNGSLFDEHGNLNNWWTDEDHEHFTKLADDMIAEFDGLPFAGQKVNGKLTVSENIADGGGLSCANEAAKREDDVDLKAFFINWSRIWRMKATTEYEQLLLNIDVHAPHELRANVQVKNLADFYSTFGVKEGDGMFLPEEKRVNIW